MNLSFANTEISHLTTEKLEIGKSEYVKTLYKTRWVPHYLLHVKGHLHWHFEHSQRRRMNLISDVLHCPVLWDCCASVEKFQNSTLTRHNSCGQQPDLPGKNAALEFCFYQLLSFQKHTHRKKSSTLKGIMDSKPSTDMFWMSSILGHSPPS